MEWALQLVLGLALMLVVGLGLVLACELKLVKESVRDLQKVKE